MKKYLFVDLDDTLFQTPAKCPPHTALAPAALYADGRVCSYSTPQQRALLATFSDQMTLIPVTARSEDAFGRVQLPFTSYAIVDFGATLLLPNRQAHSGWQQRMHPLLAQALPALQALQQQLQVYVLQQDWPVRVYFIQQGQTPCYLNLKSATKTLSHLDALLQNCIQPWLHQQGQGFYVHHNGNNLAILPEGVSKTHAVAFLLDELRQQGGPLLSIGMGDSHTDAGFMALCDYALVPKGSQLATRLTAGQHV